MAEQSDTEAPFGDSADPVVPTGEPLGSEDHDADTNTASPWPMRASPYV